MSNSKTNSIPDHIGLILDGNRRWARARGLPTLEGHREGYDNLKLVLNTLLSMLFLLKTGTEVKMKSLI